MRRANNLAETLNSVCSSNHLIQSLQQQLFTAKLETQKDKFHIKELERRIKELEAQIPTQKRKNIRASEPLSVPKAIARPPPPRPIVDRTTTRAQTRRAPKNTAEQSTDTAVSETSAPIVSDPTPTPSEVAEKVNELTVATEPIQTD